MLILFRGLSGTEFLIASLAYLVVLIVSLSVHEWAHAFAAYKFGDYTAKEQGRLTLNPLAHIDFMGFICAALFCFGWAKPVPVNPMRFRNYKKGIAWVSIAGVIANFVLAFMACGIFMALDKYVGNTNYFMLFVLMLFYTMFSLNISLFVFNLLPLYPLDGFNFIAAITKYGNAFVSFMYKYGYIILLVMLAINAFVNTSILGTLIKYISYPISRFWGLII